MREFEAIIKYLEGTGTPHRVTSTTGGQHAVGSYHYKGCAVDLAEPGPSRNTPGLLAIFAAFGSVESKLAEAIYSGAPYSIKNGKRTTVAYGNRDLLAAHWNHVHIAVPLGTFLAAPKPISEAQAMASFPNAVDACQRPSHPGHVWVVGRDGGVGAYNGAPYWGSYPGLPPEQRQGTRAFLAIDPDIDGYGYTLIADDGAYYHFRQP